MEQGSRRRNEDVAFGKKFYEPFVQRRSTLPVLCSCERHPNNGQLALKNGFRKWGLDHLCEADGAQTNRTFCWKLAQCENFSEKQYEVGLRPRGGKNRLVFGIRRQVVIIFSPWHRHQDLDEMS